MTEIIIGKLFNATFSVLIHNNIFFRIISFQSQLNASIYFHIYNYHDSQKTIGKTNTRTPNLKPPETTHTQDMGRKPKCPFVRRLMR